MSGSPSEAELKLQLQSAVDVAETDRAYFDGTALAKLDTLEQSIEGDYTPGSITTFAASVRAAYADSQAAFVTFFDGWLAEMGKFIGSQADAGDTDRLMRDVYQWFVDNSKAVGTRTITYTAPSAGGSNVGDGLVSRLTVDENAEPLEAVTVEAKTIMLVRDQITGAQRGAEVWEMRGSEPSPDGLARTTAGSGVQVEIVTRNGGSGGSLLTNSSFDEEHGADADTDKVPGWEITTGAASLEEAIGTTPTNIFIEAPGILTDDSRSLQFEDNAAIRQKFSTAGIQVDRNTPYFLRAMVRRQNLCDGTLTMGLGAASLALTMTTHTDDTWEEIIIALGQNNWPNAFYEDECDISFALTSRTVGDVLVDDVIFAPFDLIDGSYYLIRTGAIPFTVDDVFTFTDTGGAPTTAELQYHIQVNGYGYLPSATGGGINWADPA